MNSGTGQRLISIRIFFQLLILPLLLFPESSYAFHFPWDQGHDTFQPDDDPTDDEPTDDEPCENENPVNFASGYKRLRLTDFAIEGNGPDLELTRSYNSNDNADGPFGIGWRSSLTPRAIKVTDGITVSALSCQGNGRRKRFVRAGDGTYRSADGTYQSLTEASDGTLTFRDRDGTVSVFNAEGFILSKKDRYGNGLTFTYDGTGFLSEVNDTGGRKLRFISGPNGRVSEVVDPLGRRYSYRYDAEGRLVESEDPAGNTSQYRYNGNDDLVEMDDPRGVTLFSLTYDDLNRVIREDLPDGTFYRFDYLSDGVTTRVTDALQEVTTYTFNERGNVISQVNSRGERKTFTWDGDYNRTGVIDENGSSYTIEYTDSGKRAKITNALGEETRYEYSTDYNLLTKIIEADGSETALQYDAEGSLRRVTNSNGEFFQIETNDAGLISAVVDPFGTRTVLQYNRAGLLTQVGDGTNQTVMSYDAAGNLIKRIEANGATTLYTYDDRNLLIEEQRPDGGKVQYAYDRAGNMSTRTDARGNSTKFGYDSRNRLVLITEPGGLVTRQSYDGEGNLLSRTEPNGQTTTYQYDTTGRLLRETRPGGAVYQYGYDPAGNIRTLTAPNGVILTYDYDELNRLKEKLSPSGFKEVYAYDVRGNRTKIERYASDGTLTYEESFTYDSQNRLTVRQQGTSSTSQYRYDALDRLVRITDPNGGVTTQNFDAYDQLTSLVDAANETLGMTYDVVGNITSVTDPRGNTTRYKYDLLNRKTETDSPDTGITTIRYDLEGNLISSTDARGVVSSALFNERNEISSLSFPTAAEAQTFSYDVAGRLSGFQDPSGSTTYSYGLRDNVGAVDTVIGTQRYAQQFTYDGADRPQVLTYPSGAQIGVSYDSDGNVEKIQVNGQDVVRDIRYHAFGPVRSWTYGSGLTHELEYDLGYRVTGVRSGGVLDHQFVNDGLGNPTAITDNLIAGNSQTFQYDPLFRLRSATGPYGTFDVTYDPVGNRLQTNDNGTITAYTVEPGSNRLQSVGPETLSYDQSGNLIGDNRFSYVYNDADRLVRIDDQSTGSEVASYLYDAKGRRVSKRVGSSTTHYIYGADDLLIGEYDGGSGVALREYLYLGKIPIGVMAGGALYFVHSDHLLTPRAITDASQQEVWRWRSAPFGNAPANEDVDGDGTSLQFGLRFAGQFFDAESGRHYNLMRDYDPVWGRYIQSDPIGLRGGINTYAYAGNNPLFFVDPRGEKITGEWVELSVSIGKPDRPRFQGFTLGWSWWGYLKLVKVLFKINGRLSAKVRCTDTDECSEEKRQWMLSTSFPVSLSGIGSFGPNLYAIGLGLITGQIWVSIGANVVLLIGSVTASIIRLKNKYGEATEFALKLLRKQGPDRICNFGWPNLNLDITVHDL
ncbi:DUF6531 domain-containing protein [bacterium]|nr:DUF6531 domain-containing protein [bacterium]